MSVQQQPGAVLDAWLKKVYDRRLTNKYDAMVLLVGGEGVGKSTLTLELITRYFQLRDKQPDEPVEAILDRIVWSTRTEYKDQIASDPGRSVIAVPDAARVLHKKEAMVGDQREIEKDLLDVRAKEFLFLLGYQDWGVVPSLLQERRAHFILRIPARGKVEGYSRASIDKKLEMERDEWPEPDFVDKFPDLSREAPELWEAYEETDIEKKNERMAADKQQDPEDAEKAAQQRVALKMYFNDPRSSYEKVARYVDYSDGWVGDQVRAYKRGDIDPFEDVDEDGPAPSGG